MALLRGRQVVIVYPYQVMAVLPPLFLIVVEAVVGRTRTRMGRFALLGRLLVAVVFMVRLV